jgi:hypothetical protein
VSRGRWWCAPNRTGGRGEGGRRGERSAVSDPGRRGKQKGGPQGWLGHMDKEEGGGGVPTVMVRGGEGRGVRAADNTRARWRRAPVGQTG